eukprot:7279354-Pyramimonas_sp.AAC.1
MARGIQPEACACRRPRGQQGHGQRAAGPFSAPDPLARAAAFRGRARAGGRLPFLVGQAASRSE